MSTMRLSLFVVAGLVIAQLNEWKPLDQLIVAGLAILVLAFAWSRLSLSGISVTRRLPSDRSQVGRVVHDRITVQNRSLVGKLWLEVRDHSSLPGHSASRVIHVRGRRSSQWDSRTVCARRGRFQLGPVSLRSGDPFGLFPARVRMRGAIDLLVYPAIIDLPHFRLPSSYLSGGPTPDRRTQTVTPMVTAIRDYVQGDAFNRISWTATARLGKLMVKEFDMDPTSDIWILVDLDREHFVPAAESRIRRGVDPSTFEVEAWLDSTEEYAVTIAASLARAALDQGRGVGLIATGAHYEVIPAERSDRTFVKILEALTVVNADGHRPLSEVLVAESRRFNRNNSLIVVTSSTDKSWIDALALLTARRVQVSVVLVDGPSFGKNATPDDSMIEALARSRMRTYRVRNGDRVAEVMRS